MMTTPHLSRIRHAEVALLALLEEPYPHLVAPDEADKAGVQDAIVHLRDLESPSASADAMRRTARDLLSLADRLRPPDPVVWEGTLEGTDPVRIRRLDEHALIVEGATSGGLHSEGLWRATDDLTAMRAYETALLESLGTRGLPRRG